MPKLTFNDATRTALITWAQSIFPVLTIAGIWTLTSDETAIVMLLVTNTIQLAAAVFKSGQQPDPALLEEAVNTRIRQLVNDGTIIVAAAR